jgi:Arc/MetJ-type ribon-helix-helix transcriptional regulator
MYVIIKVAVYLILLLKSNTPKLARIFTMMKQQTFELDESQIKFLQSCQKYGFKDANEVVRTAIQRLELALEAERLEESADLYAEIYKEDADLQELTELGLEEWLKV